MGVTIREVKRLAENRMLVQLLGATPETDAESLANLLGTLKAIQKYDLHHVITFHNWVKRVEKFSKEVKDINAALLAKSRDDEDYGDVIIYTGFGGRDDKGKQLADQQWSPPNYTKPSLPQMII